MKTIIYAVLFILLLTACNDNGASNKDLKSDTAQAMTAAKNNYYMLYMPEDSVIEAGKEVTLSFTPKIKEKENQPVALDESHGKKVNLMVVKDDLSFFNQLWPEYKIDGSYIAKQKFPAGGKYHLILVYKPSSEAEKKTENILVNVTGKSATEEKYNSNKFTASTDNYIVTLTPNMPMLKTNELLHFDGVVKQNNKEIDASAFDTYLDGKANLVLLKMDDKSYEHSHSEVRKGHLDFHHRFKQPGIYRGWLLFQNQGEVFTTDFTFDVK
ncbi:MAG: hypothetical protein ABIQ07_02320 [Ginsengibacter sp.]